MSTADGQWLFSRPAATPWGTEPLYPLWGRQCEPQKRSERCGDVSF
jgi:hypothetical protein